MVQDKPQEGDPHAVFVDRLEHEHVVEMARARVGVIVGEDVTLVDIVAELLQAARQRRRA